MLGIPLSPLGAVDASGAPTQRTIDLGEVASSSSGEATIRSIFIIGCGAGFDAELMATTSASLKRRLGTAAYFAQGARLALRLAATPCRVTIDDELIETDATAVLIGNMGQLVPGRLGLRLPLDPSDGLLDVIVVGASSALGGLRALATSCAGPSSAAARGMPASACAATRSASNRSSDAARGRR